MVRVVIRAGVDHQADTTRGVRHHIGACVSSIKLETIEDDIRSVGEIEELIHAEDRRAWTDVCTFPIHRLDRGIGTGRPAWWLEVPFGIDETGTTSPTTHNEGIATPCTPKPCSNRLLRGTLVLGRVTVVAITPVGLTDIAGCRLSNRGEE